MPHRLARAARATSPARLRPGDQVEPRRLATIAGEDVPLPDPAGVVHLQFRRFAGCPVCNLHLRTMARYLARIEAAGVREVVVFHSPVDALRPHAADLPFDVVADPGKRLYRAFGVESSPRALLDPRAWWTILRSVAHSLAGVVRGRHPMPTLAPEGGRLGLPADILVAPDGRVIAARYGAHAGDHWDVDELLAHVAGAPRPAAGRGAPTREGSG
jgi:peroxiredoxin